MVRLRSAGAALVLAFLAVHLAFLPVTLEDLDSINFALGVRDFDVARHQPHPPGYPVYIALAKGSTAALRAIGARAAAPRGLAVWSAIAGAAALPALLVFFRRLEGPAFAHAAGKERTAVAWAAVIVTAMSPLYWVTSLRPLSDMVGFAAVMWVLAIASGTATRRAIVLAALLAGISAGIRSQTVVLTIPYLLYVLVTRRDVRASMLSAGAFVAGGLAWGIPLLAASGGLSSYLAALNFQAGADFEGVVMLWTHHTKREVAQALLDTFVWPWEWWAGVVMCALAAIGALRILVRAPRAAAALAAAFGPYAVFHLLFQETVTTRYALPLVPVVAYAAMAALEGLPARSMAAAAIGISAISLMASWPAADRYARDGAPVFRAFDDMAATAHGGDRVDAISLHAGARRAAEWSAPILPARVVKAPHGLEWLTLIDVWKGNPAARVWFVADPRRTDLALFDPRTRELARAYRWGIDELAFVGGTRPGGVDWIDMKPPNWMLDRGWSLTAEAGGITARDRQGPQRAPAVAWLKRQSAENAVLLGGRHLGAGTSPVTVRLNGTVVETFTAPSGFFMRVIRLPAGALDAAASYVPLAVTSVGDVSLEQFDAQPPGVPMFGYDTGWQEPEIDAGLARAFRWVSEKSDLWVRPIGKAVTLRIEGENPLRYFPAAPHVRVLAGNRELAAFDPASDFDQTVTLPPDAVEAAQGRITIESSKFFVPAAAGKGADQRHLALRIYRVTVDESLIPNR